MTSAIEKIQLYLVHCGHWMPTFLDARIHFCFRILYSERKNVLILRKFVSAFSVARFDAGLWGSLEFGYFFLKLSGNTVCIHKKSEHCVEIFFLRSLKFKLFCVKCSSILNFIFSQNWRYLFNAFLRKFTNEFLLLASLRNLSLNLTYVFNV